MSLKRSALSLATTLFASTLIATSVQAMTEAKGDDYWWPKKLDLSPLRHAAKTNPRGQAFNYAQAFKQLDLDALQKDLRQLMTDSQSWWPADYGHYGPFFIRMAWHSAGTYRAFDGRGGAEGGMQRFTPLNSWPDNVNLDKARRLLWPIKQKYGKAISWSDLMVLTGNVAMESMGFKTLGFAGGRQDAFVPSDVDWGKKSKWLASTRDKSTGQLDKPLAATQMGLIYVNPEGPGGKPSPLLAAKSIRETFARMAMNDEETVALIAGGHTFGKAHGAAPAAKYVGPAPAAASITEQGFGWKNSYQTGHGPDTISSGLEGAWTVNPVQWTHNYLQNLFNLKWVKTKSPGGATQWQPADKQAKNLVPDAFDKTKRHPPMMFTTDLSLKFDPRYKKIAKHFQENPKAFERAFAKAWFKLTHRDMGPRSRYLGKLVPKEVMLWQDPIPPVDHPLVDKGDIATLKKTILDSKLSVSDLVQTAWASAATFRGTDKRGGANGGRIRLMPQKEWAVNQPAKLHKVLMQLEAIKTNFNQTQAGDKKISLADLIVLGGAAAIEQAAAKAGIQMTVPFIPGRTDATQADTDIQAFNFLKPSADGFINYIAKDNQQPPTKALIDKASLLNLSVPEMVVLVGGMRSLNANYEQTPLGVLTDKPGTLSNDFFVNLLDMATVWKKSPEAGVYEGFDRDTGKLKWQASSVDLIFGSNSELRAVAEVYAMQGGQQLFINDFVKAWTKVMTLDRFELSNKTSA